MRDAISLFGDLEDSDVDTMFAIGIERQVIASSAITREGQVPDALYIVLEGLLGVRVRSVGPDAIQMLGPGEIVGEIAFLDSMPASATVEALENSLLLTIPRVALQKQLAEDPAFAARLYRALARSLARRMRDATATIAHWLHSASTISAHGSELWADVDARLSAFKTLLADAERQAMTHGDMLPDEMGEQILAAFRDFALWFNEKVGDASTTSIEVRQEIGARVQRELLPYMMLAKNGERWYRKPRGYAGDFLSIEWIYENHPDGAGRLGPTLDRCFLDMFAARAVCNRRALLAEEIGATLADQRGTPARVLSMACGPAREIFDVFERLSDPKLLFATLIDIDFEALAFVANIRDKRGLKRFIQLENGNLVYVATGRRHLDVPPQDLVYSIGLIDYFDDSFVIRLLNYVHDVLRPGGRVILGNFHPRNPSRALMDYVWDWKLIHRDEANMNRLFEQSKFGGPCDRIRFESERINLFAIRTKR
jgi:CRP-like cAMP-binding protein/SAM-dependent methyltransferase